MCDVTHSCMTSLIHVGHDAFICMGVLSHTNATHTADLCLAFVLFLCDKSRSYVWHDSFICVVRMCDMTQSYPTWLIYKSPCSYVISLVRMCDMTHSYVWHDSSICVTCLICLCDMTHSYMACLIHMCDMTHLNVWHDSSMCVTRLIHMCNVTHCVTWLIRVFGMARLYVC